MLAFKRWIALAPLAGLLLAGMPGCKTGAKLFSCRQTNCSQTTKPACGESQTLCKEAGKSVCTSSKVACASTSTEGCLGENGSAVGCKTSCAATTACATSAGCLSHPASKTSCASLGCVTMGQPIFGNQTMTSTANPVINPPAIVPQNTSAAGNAQVVVPDAFPEEQVEEFPLPIPAPPAEAAQNVENPFLRVAQIEELIDGQAVANPFAEREAASNGPLPVGHQLSKPWADALGLPAKTPEPIQYYPRN